MNPFKPPLRPPGAVSEKEFPVRCIRCGRCVETCPHDSIRLVEGVGASRLTPHVIPSEHPCLLCMKCPPVCPSGALDNTLTDMKRVHMGRAFILRDRCHNYTDGTICMTCYDRCPLRGRAVELEDGLIPRITSACAGCGMCEYVCPVGAIEIYPTSAHWVPASAVPTKHAEEPDPMPEKEAHP